MSAFILITNTLGLCVAIMVGLVQGGVFVNQPWSQLYIFRLLEFFLLISLIGFVDFRSEKSKKSTLALLRPLLRYCGCYSSDSDASTESSSSKMDQSKTINMEDIS